MSKNLLKNGNKDKYRREQFKGKLKDWKLLKCYEVCSLITDGTHYSPINIGEGIPFLTVKDMYSNGLDFINCSYISYEEYKKALNNNCSPKIGDVLFSKDGTVGKVYVLKDRMDFVVLSSIAILRPKHTILNNLFLGQILSSEKFLYQATQQKTGSALRRIVLRDIKNLKIPIPPLPEQKKIAQILSTWDRAIEKTEQLIEARTSHKKALMQQILTGKKRFKEFEGKIWNKLNLSDFAIPSVRTVNKPEKNYLALGIRSHGKGTFLKPDFDPKKIEMTTLYEVKEDDLIVNITFAWEGAIAIVKKEDEGALVSHRFPTYEFNRDIVIPEYFKYVILQKSFVYKLGLISPGGAGRNRVLDKKDFENLEVKIPPLPEQQKIALFLNTCHEEIGLLNKKLDALKKQKKGLMQKLLTGQIRVKV